MKLSTYMQREHLTLTALAGRLRRPVSTVHGWVHETRRPGWDDVALIERVTAGAVLAADFVPRSRSKASALLLTTDADESHQPPELAEASAKAPA